MSVLASLARAYDRLPDAAPFGFSPERIGALVSLHPDGTVASITDLRSGAGKKRQAPAMLVPQAVKRTVAIAPNFLWDKTAYALGLTAGEGKRTAQEHAAFRARHVEWLEDAEDEGLRAFLLFLDLGAPGEAPPGWSDDLLDQNVAFSLEADRLSRVFLHDRPAAREAWRRVSGAGAREAQACLVTGEAGPVARLHPSIKGVWGAQSSGASLVSFNLDAFASYGHEQGDNAPISEASAFAYAAVRPDDASVAKAAKLNPRSDDEASAVRQFMCDNFSDVRTFGGVLSTGINAGQVRGPVQFAFGRSAEPVLPLEVSITRMAATNEAERKTRVEGEAEDDGEKRGERRTMGRKHVIPYGLYRAHGFVSAALAARTGFSGADLDLLFEALARSGDRARSGTAAGGPGPAQGRSSRT